MASDNDWRTPVGKHIKGLPAFTTIRSGACFFVPGIRAPRFLASGKSEHAS